jgi:hypothetical protein
MTTRPEIEEAASAHGWTIKRHDSYIILSIVVNRRPFTLSVKLERDVAQRSMLDSDRTAVSVPPEEILRVLKELPGNLR